MKSGDKDTVAFRVTKNAYASEELAHLLAALPVLRQSNPPSILPPFLAIAELRSHRRRLHEKSYQRTSELAVVATAATMTTTNALCVWYYAAEVAESTVQWRSIC